MAQLPCQPSRAPHDSSRLLTERSPSMPLHHQGMAGWPARGRPGQKTTQGIMFSFSPLPTTAKLPPVTQCFFDVHAPRRRRALLCATDARCLSACLDVTCFLSHPASAASVLCCEFMTTLSSESSRLVSRLSRASDPSSPSLLARLVYSRPMERPSLHPCEYSRSRTSG